jgi:hypothetical protein
MKLWGLAIISIPPRYCSSWIYIPRYACYQAANIPTCSNKIKIIADLLNAYCTGYSKAVLIKSHIRLFEGFN